MVGVSGEKVEMEVWNLQRTIDLSNLLFIETVFKKYGYPGKTLVDTPTNEVAWYVIQHSEKIPQYFEMIKKAGIKKRTPLYPCGYDGRPLLDEPTQGTNLWDTGHMPSSKNRH